MIIQKYDISTQSWIDLKYYDDYPEAQAETDKLQASVKEGEHNIYRLIEVLW